MRTVSPVERKESQSTSQLPGVGPLAQMDFQDTQPKCDVMVDQSRLTEPGVDSLVPVSQ